MRIARILAPIGIAAALMSGSVDMASARHYRHHHRSYSRQLGGGEAADATIVGTALGLLGAGIAGASDAGNGYGYGYPAYGQGYPGFGAYGPGYGYYGY